MHVVSVGRLGVTFWENVLDISSQLFRLSVARSFLKIFVLICRRKITRIGQFWGPTFLGEGTPNFSCPLSSTVHAEQFGRVSFGDFHVNE